MNILLNKLFAATNTIPTTDLNIPPLKPEDIIVNALNVAYFVSGIVALIAIIISGYFMVTLGGDPTAAAKARNTIIYSVVGIVIIIAAAAITNFVKGLF